MMNRKTSITRICSIVLLFAAAVLITVLLTGCSKIEDYYGGLFDADRVHSIDVQISESDWEALLKDPKAKEKFSVDIVIDGEKTENVSFATKGNSSLTFVAEAGLQRFSYKVNFGKNVKGQTFHGLDKLNLQNIFSDATYMKDHVAYELFRNMDVAAPLSSYVWLTVNGKEQGLYLAVEDMDSAFIDRALKGEGNLYGPETEGLALTEEELERIKRGEPLDRATSEGSDLVYRDDDPESYPDIFDNAVNKADDEAKARVIKSLKALSEKKDLDEVLDTSEILRYLAVHDFLCNYDSYIGLMLHNYYLYEKNGKLSMLPWDYNLSWGTFPLDLQLNHFNDSNEVINMDIDSPLAGMPEDMRPMWSWVTSDEKYLKEYHKTFSELIKKQIDSDRLISFIDKVYKLISPYVQKDPTAFYTAEEVAKGYETLKKVVELRGLSVKKQLNGEPADVDTSGILIKDMGGTITMMQMINNKK